MIERERVALVGVLVVGAVLRADATGRTPSPDASGYLYMARHLSWLDPWRASPREPLWIAVVKLATAPLGYRIEAMQALSCLVGVLALVACVWALRQLGCRPWTVVAGTAAIAFSERLIVTAGQGTRETMAVLVTAVAVGLAARSPRWLAVLAAIALGVRWELGLALFALSIVLLVGRVIGLRWVLVGAALGAVLMGPFLVNNAREYDDPLFHSDIHATFYANLEDTRGVVLTEPLLPPEERIRPEIAVPMYRAPLISWGDFVLDVVGPREIAQREAKALVVLPVDALRLGWLPWPVGAVLLVGAIAAALQRRDRAVLVLTGLSAATVLGYGMMLPWFDRRLVSHLTVLLVMLVCAAPALCDRSVSERRPSRARSAPGPAGPPL